MFRPCTIGDFVQAGVADIQTGPFGTQLKASEYVSDGVPVINVRNIGYSDLRPDKLEFVTEAKAEQLGVHRIQSGDIVFGRKGAVDRHLFVGADQQDWVQGSDCIRLRIDTDDINPRFISYALLSEPHKKWMLNQCGNKATMASLNQDVVKRIPLRVPDRTAQDGIVAVLSAYDDLIENNRRRIALLEDAARQLYKEWFARFRFPGHEHVAMIDGIPEDWERVAFRDIAVVKKGKNITKDSVTEGEVPVVAGGLSPAYYHGTANVLGSAVTISASGANAGFTNYYQQDIWASDCSYLSEADNDNLRYLYLLLKHRQIDLTAMQKGAAQPHVYPKDIERLEVLDVPARLLKQFSDWIDPVFDQVATLQMLNHLLARARDLLLPKLMNGTLTV